MVENRSVAVFLAIVLFAAPVWAQTPVVNPGSAASSALSARTSESLSSSAVAERFREIGRELARTETITGPQAEQAILFLTAAGALDRTATDVAPLLMKLAVKHSERDYSDHMMAWLQSYVSGSADRAIVMEAVQYLLDRTHTIEQRKAVLENLVSRIGNRNPAVDSEIATLLGQVMVEKGEKDAGKFYLLQAYGNNRYNKTAFAKLMEMAPNEIGPGVYLEHLRLVLQENPLNIKSAVDFAQYAERLQLYDLSASSYQYCADLFRYLYPSEPLPPYLYLPWAVSCYNSRQKQLTCLQIAESVRTGGQFDILLEAVAAKAAVKAGKSEEAARILKQAEQKADQLLQTIGAQPSQTQQDAAVRQINSKQIAWFYCFGSENATKAVVWANQAYSAEPNSPAAGALLAYALSMSNQLEWAKPLLASFEHTQIADLVQAKIHLADGNKAGAIQTLRMAIPRDPGSFVAEKARQMLKELGSEYVSPIDGEALLTYLSQNLGKSVVPQFLPPNRIIEAQLSIRGTDFSYGNDLEGTIGIANRGAEPLVITADSLFRGSFRVTARVTGDIKKEFPNVFSQTVRTDLIVPPGRTFTYPAKLSTGELRDVLTTYPQASLDIEFTLYLDPVNTSSGTISNRLVDVKPVTISIKRPATEITASYVRGRYNTLSSGQQNQRIQTARLFTGLLKEQQAMTQHGTLYPYRYAKWLPELLRSSLVSPSGLLLSPGADDWVVKVNAMADMLSLSLDQELATAVAKNLNHAYWPVRLMAVYLLATSSGNDFQPVLDWAAKQDPNELVRNMALSLQTSALTTPMNLPGEQLTTIQP
ncbi:MAG: hypothetical protein KBE65_04855 [Phycisphaerae bacterium]|nr:hypothetical protein [Phycisphaerae bacterium]